MTKDEAARFEKERADRVQRLALPSSGDRSAPPKTRFRGASEQLHVVERFSRLDAKTLRYRFTIEDPSTWERPWSGEEVWPATKDLMYEYACDEAHYALGNILRGAQLRERHSQK